MIRQILKATEPSLRKKSKTIKKIDKKVLSLITDLKDTLEVQNDPEGVGLAAPQIGKNVRVFIVKLDRGLKTVINPEILKMSSFKKDKTPKSRQKKKNKIMEGCLSLPHYYGPLKRAGQIKIKYLDENGKTKVETFTKFGAQIIQHEIDHLNGILFVDKLLQQKTPLYEFLDGEWEKVDLIT